MSNWKTGRWRPLERVSAKRCGKEGTAVTDLIRTAIEERDLRSGQVRVEAFRNWKAPSRDRVDIGDTDEYLRGLRADDRL